MQGPSYHKLWALFLLLLSLHSIKAQQGGLFYHLTSDNGLSSNRVRDILQDRDGYYWIATEDGLNRFDGINCIIYRKAIHDSTSLSNNFCFDLHEDRTGDIWVSTFIGLNRFKKKSAKFERFYFNHPLILPNVANNVRKTTEDNNGNIWVATGLLWKWDRHSEKWSVFLHRNEDNTTIPDGLVRYVDFDSSRNGIWMLVNQSVVFYDLNKEQFFHAGHNPEDLKIFTFHNTYILTRDLSGRLWFIDKNPVNVLYCFESGNQGIRRTNALNEFGIRDISTDNKGRIWIHYWLAPTVIFDPQTGKADLHFLEKHSGESALSNVSTSLFIDRAGTYWIGSNAGVSIYEPAAQAMRRFILDAGFKTTEQSRAEINSLVAQNEQYLWAGTGAGLIRIDKRTGKQKLFNHLPLPNKAVKGILINTDGKIWAGGHHKIVIMETGGRIVKTIATKGIFTTLAYGGEGNVFAAAWNNGIYLFNARGDVLKHYLPETDKTHSIKTSHIVCIITDTIRQTAWIGYNISYGFSRLDYRQHQFEHFELPAPSSDFGTFNTIDWVTEDKTGKLWLATFSTGLVYFDPVSGIYQTFGQNEGLTNEFVHQTAFDKKGNLWIATGNGIFIMDTAKKTINFSGIKLPELSNDVQHNIIIHNERMYFFKSGEIVETIPEDYFSTAYPSRLLITSVQVYDKEIFAGYGQDSLLSIRLPYNQNHITIGFSLLKPDPSHPVLFSYMLEGFDKDWNHAGNRTVAGFTNVPPGKYTFRLKALNPVNQSVYYSAAIPVFITPPFWKTWWFYLLSAAISGILIFFLYRYRISQIRNSQLNQLKLVVETQEKEKKNISAQLHDDLGVRLSALKYFITSLHQYLKPGDGKAKEILQRTVSVVDESVDDIRYLLINLSPKTLHEFGYLSAVEDLVNKLRKLHIVDIELMQQGMEERLQPEIESGLYRITQEFINNTLKHADARRIELKITRDNGMIKLDYHDDGKGFNPDKKSSGYGLENILTRVDLLKGKIEWRVIENRVTGASIQIPFNHT